MFEETFSHSTMRKPPLFIVGHPGRHCSVLAADRNTSANRLNEFGDFLVRAFVTDAYRLGKVLRPIELYSATEGLEIPPKGSVVFGPGLLQERRIFGCCLCVTKRCAKAKHQRQVERSHDAF
jgi:hypothetical protein